MYQIRLYLSFWLHCRTILQQSRRRNYILLVYLLSIFPLLNTGLSGQQNDDPISYENFEWDKEENIRINGFFRQLIHGISIPRNRNSGQTDATQTEFQDTSDLHPSQEQNQPVDLWKIYENEKAARESKRALASQTRTRLRMRYESGNLRFEGSGNLDFTFANYTDDPAFPLLWNRRIRNRLISAERSWDEQDYLIQADVHRLFLNYANGPLDITAGRQAIGWGEGRFLNPLDLITPTGPFILDLEDVPGADAINTIYSFSQYNYLQAVIQPMVRKDERNMGKLRSQDTNAILRFKGTFGNTDLIVLGGHHYRSGIWGMETVTAAWDAVFRFSYLGRAENQNYAPDPLSTRTAHQIIIGSSYTFFGTLRSNLEIFYNSAHYNNEPVMNQLIKEEALISANFMEPLYDDISYFRTKGRIITKNPYLIQGSLGFDITNTIAFDIFLIADPRGGSAMYGPSLTYQYSDEGLFIIGGRIYGFHGKSMNRRYAEFEGSQKELYALIRHHF